MRPVAIRTGINQVAGAEGHRSHNRIATSVRGRTGVAVGGQPSVQLGRVAGTVALHSHVDGLAGDGRIGGVLDGKRGRSRRGIATIVGSRERHRSCSGRTTEVAESLEVIAPGHASTGITGSAGVSVGGEPSVELGRVACAIALYSHVDGLAGNFRSGGVFDGERGGGVRLVAALVRGREGHRTAARGTAVVRQVEEVVAPREVTADVLCRSTTVVVQPSLELGRISCTVTLHGQVFCGRNELRPRRVFDGERERGVRHISAVIRSRPRYRSLSRCSAVVAEQCAGLFYKYATAVVRNGNTGIPDVKPCCDLRNVSATVALHCHGAAFRLEGRRRGILDGEGRRCGRGIAVDVRCREGHVDGTRQPTFVRHVVDVIIVGDGVHQAVVGGRGATMVGQPGVQVGQVATAVTLDREVGSRRDDRILIVGHRHVEAGRRGVTVNIHARVGHGRRTHCEGGARAVGAREGRNTTVVGSRRLRPGHGSRAVARVVRLRDVGGRACDGRCFIIRHRHGEGRRGGVAGGVHSRVGHGRRAHGERVARAVSGGEAGHSAVVGGRRLRPGHGRAAVACIVGL